MIWRKPSHNALSAWAVTLDAAVTYRKCIMWMWGLIWWRFPLRMQIIFILLTASVTCEGSVYMNPVWTSTDRCPVCLRRVKHTSGYSMTGLCWLTCGAFWYIKLISRQLWPRAWERHHGSFVDKLALLKPTDMIPSPVWAYFIAITSLALMQLRHILNSKHKRHI